MENGNGVRLILGYSRYPGLQKELQKQLKVFFHVYLKLLTYLLYNPTPKLTTEPAGPIITVTTPKIAVTTHPLKMTHIICTVETCVPLHKLPRLNTQLYKLPRLQPRAHFFFSCKA